MSGERHKRRATNSAATSISKRCVNILIALFKLKLAREPHLCLTKFEVEWNEAQFDTESRLRNEAAPVSELHFTPGNPRNVRVGVSYLFQPRLQVFLVIQKESF